MKPWILIGGGLLLFALTNGRGTVDNAQFQRDLAAQATDARREERQQRLRAREAAQLASVSLDRIKAGCIHVGRRVDQVDPSRGVIEGTLLIEGMTVTDWAGMPLGDGTLVCTEVNTGVVQGGVVTQVANVAPSDLGEYMGLFNQIAGRF